MTHVQTKGNNREEPCSKLKLSDKPQAKVALLQIKDFLRNSRFPSSCQLPADITIYSYFFLYVKKRLRGPEELNRFGLLPKNNQKTFQLEYDIVLNRIKTGFHAA